MLALLNLVSPAAALAIHAMATPLFFTAIAWHYFHAPGARDAVPTAITWTAIVVLLDLAIIAGITQHSLAIFKSFAGSWLLFGLIFIATWITGDVMSMVPPTKFSPGGLGLASRL
jgi:hypothetical protein